MKAALARKINNTNWYRQGGSICIFFTSLPYKNALGKFGGFNYFKGFNNYGYFEKDRERLIADEVIKKQLRDPGHLRKAYIKRWNIIKSEQDRFNGVITEKNLRKLTDRKFVQLNQEFTLLRDKIWKVGILIETFDPWGDTLIVEFLKRHNVSLGPDKLAALLAPNKLHFMPQEKLDRLRLTLAYINGKDIRASLAKHAKNYFWLHNSWAETYYLGEKHFLGLIKKDAAKGKKWVLGKISALASQAGANRKRKLKLRGQLPKAVWTFLQFFSDMADWRDDRKAQVMRTNHCANCLLNEIARRSGISKKYLFFLYPPEFRSFAHLKKLEPELKKRQQSCIYYAMENGKLAWYTGREADEIHRVLESRIMRSDEIKGTAANLGYVKGYVKLILSKADFVKVKRGDIIVTQMTRPEHTPILHKAAAIITDEGGLTCHAAIVSRELGVPCIIGTQSATSVLKDNDYVEVDANKGIVRKLK